MVSEECSLKAMLISEKTGRRRFADFVVMFSVPISV